METKSIFARPALEAEIEVAGPRARSPACSDLLAVKN